MPFDISTLALSIDPTAIITTIIPIVAGIGGLIWGIYT